MYESFHPKQLSSSLFSEEEEEPHGLYVEDVSSQSTNSSSLSTTPEHPVFASSAKSSLSASLLPKNTASMGVFSTATTLANRKASPETVMEYDDGGESDGVAHNRNQAFTTSTNHPKSTSMAVEAFPDAFHRSPEPIHKSSTKGQLDPMSSPSSSSNNLAADHHYHLLRQIREDEVANEQEEVVADDGSNSSSSSLPPPTLIPLVSSSTASNIHDHHPNAFHPCFTSTRWCFEISKRTFVPDGHFCYATWVGFWALLHVTCASYILTPMRDAVALQVGVAHMPKLTLASSVLAFLSSVPIGWLFEAPDPSRRKVWKKMGLTRGETQGTSLALFYRFFALAVLSYAVGFYLVDWWRLRKNGVVSSDTMMMEDTTQETMTQETAGDEAFVGGLLVLLRDWIPIFLSKLGKVMYIAFFLVVHLMKLHSISLVWGVTTEAMEYEDVARKQYEQKHILEPKSSKTRLQRLALVGFGGTLGGIWGSVVASSMANILSFSGLLIVAAFLLEISAELSIELGRIMQKHWEEQQIFKSSCQDLASLDASMKRSASLGSMKRVASGNSLYSAANNMKRVASGNSISQSMSAKSLSELEHTKPNQVAANGLEVQKNDNMNGSINASSVQEADDNTFTQRLMRGITTILQSRLLMAIFTYNALLASTTVLLSFRRAELVANRNASETSVSADTAFLANINMASSVAVFAMQASGAGAWTAQTFGSRGSLALMPAVRLFGVLCLAWWHRYSQGQAPNLILFLILDECTRVINLAVAKPVRESLWRGLSNEARYEAKPIVDTLANRWGAGSASFCVSMLNKVLLYLGVDAAMKYNAEPQVFGLPPVLFLCLIVAVWWAMVSLDLGHIRKRIDMELKKRQ